MRGCPPPLPPAASVPLGADASIHAAPDWRLWLTGIYLAVAGMMLLRLIVGLVLSWGLLRAARPVRDGWAQRDRVRASAAIATPVTIGSSILLPVDCTGWAAATLQAVLAHERAHVACGDFYVQILSQVNRALFWFSPLSWWLHNHLAALAELASDDAAIAALGDAPGYAAILLEMAGRPGRLLAGVAMARPATVCRRIERILAERTTPERVSRFRRAAFAISVVPLALAAALSIAGAAPPDKVVLAEQQQPHTPIVIDPKLLDVYAGFYFSVKSGSVMEVTRDSGHLVTRWAGKSAVAEYPYTDHDFFLTVAPMQNSFVTDASGAAIGMVHHQNGYSETLERISAGEGQRIAAEITQRIYAERTPHVPVRIDPNLLDNYVGTYRLTPQLIFTVTRDGDRLFARRTGQRAYWVHPYTDHDFFYTVFAAQLSFVPSSNDEASALILHENGRDRTARRVDSVAAQALDRKVAEQRQPHIAISTDPHLIDGYVGRSRNSESEIIAARAGNQLFVQATGSGGYTVYPYTDHDFFATVAPAEISFTTDKTGKATQLIQHEHGVDAVLNRVD